MGPSHMVSMGFIETTTYYPATVSECIREGGRWVLLVRAGKADYVFNSNEEWHIGDDAIVAVTMGADGKQTQAIARPV